MTDRKDTMSEQSNHALPAHIQMALDGWVAEYKELLAFRETAQGTIEELQRQVAEADAARRHAQEVSTKLVEDKRALEAKLSLAVWPNVLAPAMYDNPDPGWEDPRVPDLAKIRQLAREVGYSIGLHGSLKRDVDLIAAPWTEQAAGNADLVEHLCVGLPAERVGWAEYKPHGRVAVTLQIDGYFKPVDLSIMPRIASETIASVTTWANETFGPATIEVQIDRAWKEFRELLQLRGLDTGKIAEEAADVCICLYRVIGTLDPEAISKKMAKNRARKWMVDGQGCAQHVGE